MQTAVKNTGRQTPGVFYENKIKNAKTTIPRTIRYHPKTLKSCLRIYPIKKRITTRDVTKATVIPTSKIINSGTEKANPNFTIFSRLAPNITGTARKNVYSAATVRESPSMMPPSIVAPERDVPGNTAAISWNIPIQKAVCQVIYPTEFTPAGFPPLRFSIHKNATPKRISITATVW